jgi:hypothetical protein
MANDAKKNSVPLKKVVLYKHGMGYFERRGVLDGSASIEILCGAADIDDMLKSLMVLSSDGARLEAITYDSAKTLEDRMTEFGFDMRKAKGLIDIIGQIKGLPVSVLASGTKASGRVVGIDYLDHVASGDKVTKEPFLIMLADATFRRLSLSSISSITVEDETFSTELNQQLELLFQNARKKDKKALTVVLPESKGEVVVAYSIPSPIWKTSYRIVVVDNHILIQGMAIVDNVQDEDWTDVSMVLVSAAPISFIQPLYDPVQPNRARVNPQGYKSSGPVVAERAQRSRGMADAAVDRLEEMAVQSWGAPVPAAAPAAPGGGGSYGSFREGRIMAEMMAAQAMEQSLPVDAGSSGELFEYRVANPVTVPRNTSALIPIVQGEIEGNKLSLYNAMKNRKHPYCAIRLINTTGLTLEAGPVTVLEEDAYAGEALLDVLKPDDKRFLPYAVDQDVHVITRNAYNEMPIYRVRIFGSTLYMDYRSRTSTIYRLENLSEKIKSVYVEHEVSYAMKLVGDASPVETTDSYYRFEVMLGPQAYEELTVTQEEELSRTVWIADPENLDRNVLRYLIDTNELTKEMADQLRQILAKHAALVDIVEKRKAVQARIQQYVSDQQRARENLKALGAHNERYRLAIDEAEDRIMKANAELTDLQAQFDALRAEFHELVMRELEAEIAR